MAYKTYLGIRRVSHLEYLIAFLGSVRDGYDREDTRRHIQKILEWFEIEKAKVLGKKKAHPVSGASLVPECEIGGRLLRQIFSYLISNVP